MSLHHDFTDDFMSQLNGFGKDLFFSFTSLFDPINLDNNKFVASPIATDYLTLTLLSRLEKSYYIQLEAVSSIYQLDDQTQFIYFPSYPLNFSYILISNNEKQPVTLYVNNGINLHNQLILSMINEEQKKYLDYHRRNIFRSI